MISVGCENLSLSFGGETILKNISFSLNDGDKLGIVGVNGAGKSSLLRMITGEYSPDNGKVYIAKEHTLAVLDQHPSLEPGRSIYDELLSVFGKLVRDEQLLEGFRIETEAGSEEAAGRYASLYDHFVSDGGLTFRSRCRGMLLRFGFDEGMFDRKTETLSGGQKTRLALVKLLLSEPDIMLLDEPTNHLDTETMFWLEDYLTGYKKTVITVSHDRYFLDRVCTKIMEIEYGRCKVYTGGYTSFIERKNRDREIQERHYRNQQREIARIEAYIEQQRRWNRERNIIAAESREKQLAKLERIEKPRELPKSARIHFSESGESGGEVICARELSKRYGDGAPLFEHLGFLIEKRERVFICGANGCGKSTLLKIIADKLEADTGNIEFGYNVTVGYYDQENQQLDDSLTVLDEIWNAYPKLTQTEVRNALAQFLFTGEDVMKSVGVLSGGERARLTLVKLMLSRMNLLILDEPTNHLDIMSREALEDALMNFDGTILAVSHDRYFISKLATRVLSFSVPAPEILRRSASENRGLTATSGIFDFRGSYDEYIAWLDGRSPSEESDDAVRAETTEAKQQYLENKKNASERRKAENRIKRAKAESEKVESEIAELEEQLSSDESGDYKVIAELYDRKTALEERLMELYEIIMDGE